MSDSHLLYDNPLIGRYASKAMAERWGPLRKFRTWRRLWLALAESEAELGLLASDGKTPRIKPEQLAELRDHLDDIDFARAEHYEAKLRHDVMAHIHALGEVAPKGREIVHLGATSCFVTDNTDLLLMRESLDDLLGKLASLIDTLGSFASKWKSEPAVGFTHFQPAQLTTVGKRATLWCYDLVLDIGELEYRRNGLKFRGAKGTTGTQASFLELFGGDHDKVRDLDHRIAKKMGFDDVIPVSGQTYTRKLDTQILDALGGLGQSLHKWGCDLRLLAHRQEIDEPAEAGQVGSSAMPYKRNPMRSERMCGLGRFLISLASNAANTAATQWLERSLDDSVNRRLSLPQAFLTADACLRLALNITSGLQVFPAIIARNLNEVLPYMASETLLMAAVAQGADRQEVHEVIRKHSRAVTANIQAGVGGNDLLERLATEPAFFGVDMTGAYDVKSFIGRAPEQVDEFIAEEIDPVRRRYPHLLEQSARIDV